MDNEQITTQEPWPGSYRDLQIRRVKTLARLGTMLSIMAGGEAAEVVGYDAADLHAEVLMALAIEDADSTDAALDTAQVYPDGDMLVCASDDRAARLERLEAIGTRMLRAIDGSDDDSPADWPVTNELREILGPSS